MTNNKTKYVTDAERAVNAYGDSLFRLCMVMLRNPDDAKDAVQDTFLSYISFDPVFNDAEHEKAWLIRTATNRCKDMLRKQKTQNYISLEEAKGISVSENTAQIFGLLSSLEEKYRIVIHLHYIEGYKSEEIAKMLSISNSAVKKRLQRGREMLREEHGREAL